MSVGVVIPFRGLSLAKTRLRARLSSATVEALSERMLSNVLTAARSALPEAPVVLITRMRVGLVTPTGVTVLEQPLDLNEAIEFACDHLVRRGSERVLVLSSDLPLITGGDVRVLSRRTADIVIAPDEAGRGTNGLVCPIHERGFFRFGHDSALLHAEEAQRRRLSVQYVRTPGLARDVDTVDQIDDAVRAACATARARD